MGESLKKAQPGSFEYLKYCCKKRDDIVSSYHLIWLGYSGIPFPVAEKDANKGAAVHFCESISGRIIHFILRCQQY